MTLPQKTIADFVGLLKSAVEGKPYHGSRINWREILRLSSFHRVDNLIFEAISMLPDEEKPSGKVLAELEQDSITQVIQDTNQISETEELMTEFEQHHIHAIMLKGWIMKELYPRTALRHRADTDIFVHASDEKTIHQIILNHEFRTVAYGGKKDNVYSKEPFVTLEMHKNLFEYEDDWNEVINNKYGHQYIWKRIEKLGNYHYVHKMDKELYYVYMVAHMAKHLKVFAKCQQIAIIFCNKIILKSFLLLQFLLLGLLLLLFLLVLLRHCPPTLLQAVLSCLS